MSYTGIPTTEQIKFKGKGPLDEKSFIESVSELSEIDEKYIQIGQMLFCVADGGHYIWYPYEGITTAPISGSWYLYEQVQFDRMFPIGSTRLILQNGETLPQPISPASCTWDDITSSYNSRALWFNSTDPPGTLYDGALPNIIGYMNGVLFDDGGSGVNCGGAFYANGTPRSRSWTGAGGDCIRNYAFNAARSNAVYDNTSNIVRPTSVTAKLYRRSA